MSKWTDKDRENAFSFVTEFSSDKPIPTEAFERFKAGTAIEFEQRYADFLEDMEFVIAWVNDKAFTVTLYAFTDKAVEHIMSVIDKGIDNVDVKTALFSACALGGTVTMQGDIDKIGGRDD